jgi:hypothetical protein
MRGLQYPRAVFYAYCFYPITKQLRAKSFRCGNHDGPVGGRCDQSIFRLLGIQVNDASHRILSNIDDRIQSTIDDLPGNTAERQRDHAGS